MINSNDLYEFIMKEHKNNNQISLNFNRSVSYRMLENEVERCCLKLSNEGIKEGSRVALRVVHSYSLIYLILALWKNNNQVMLLDPRLKENEVNELIHIAKPNFYIESIQQHSLLAKFKEEVEIKLVKHYDDSHSDHVSLILSSSGSTGIPKIIGRTPESIIEEIKNTTKQEGSIRKDDTVLILSSLHHSYGLITALLHSLYSGATVTFSPSNQKSEIINTLINKKVSALFAVPAHYELLTNSFEQATHPRLRIALSAGDILKEETFDRFHDQFGIPIGLNYGMTEVGMISIDFLGRFPQTCGPICCGFNYKVLNDQLYLCLPHSPYLTQVTDNRYEDQWLKTNDICEMKRVLNTEVLIIKGRSDSLIIIGGLKVNLMEIEMKLKNFSEINEALVIFNDKDQWIEAYISPNKEIELTTLLSWCKEHFAHYKIPKRFHLVEMIPKTATGKIKRVITEPISPIQTLST